VEPSLKYGGEAVFFLGAAFRLLRWAWGAISEGDAPPSAFVDMPVPPGAHHPPVGTSERIASILMAHPDQDGGPAAWYRVGNPDPPPAPGDPALFPPEMLAAMTPEEREHIAQALAAQRSPKRTS
jgi:hypothetical protein